MSLLIIPPKKFKITYDAGEGKKVILNVKKSQFEGDEFYQKNIVEMKCLSCNYHSKFTHKIFHTKKNHSSNYFCEKHNASYPSFKSLQKDHPHIESSDLVVTDRRVS